MYRASELGHREIVELFLQAGADKAFPCQNLTPLLVAVQKGHMHIVQLLMSSSFEAASAASSSSNRSGRSETSGSLFREADISMVYEDRKERALLQAIALLKEMNALLLINGRRHCIIIK